MLQANKEKAEYLKGKAMECLQEMNDSLDEHEHAKFNSGFDNSDENHFVFKYK